MASYKSTGIILGRTNYAEADRILTILTNDHGKVSALAKAARKTTSKLGPSLEPFCVIELMFAIGKNLDIVTHAKIKQTFPKLTTDLELMKRGFLACEMINKLTPHHTTAEVYDLLVETFGALNDRLDPGVVELWFKLKLLDLLGYRPNLEQTLKSHDEIVTGGRYAFSPAGGGVVTTHQASATDPVIGEDHIKLWRLLLVHDIAKVAKLGGSSQAAKASLPVANEFYDYLFGKRFKSSEI